jgi:hypothetical protein
VPPTPAAPVADGTPGLGRDVVSDLMREADAAAEQARLTETEADRLAQRAKDDADRAARSPMTAIGGVQRAHMRARVPVSQLWYVDGPGD